MDDYCLPTGVIYTPYYMVPVLAVPGLTYW